MAFQYGAFQGGAFQASAATVAQTGNNYAGGFGRRWYRHKGQSYLFSPYELAMFLQAEHAVRQDLQIKRAKRHRTVSRQEWARIMESISSLNVGMQEPIAVVDDYDDEEAALELLMAYI